MVTQHPAVAEVAAAGATGSGPKAENSGQNTLPFFSVPSTATYSSGHAAEQREDPLAAADAERRSTLANRSVARRSSA